MVDRLNDRVLVALRDQPRDSCICLMVREVEGERCSNTDLGSVRVIVGRAVLRDLRRIILRFLVRVLLSILNSAVVCPLRLGVLCLHDVLGQGLAVLGVSALRILVLVQSIVDICCSFIILIALLRVLVIAGLCLLGILLLLLFAVGLVALELGQEPLHICTECCSKSHAVILIIGICLDEHVAVRVESSVHLRICLGRSDIDRNCRADCTVVRRSKTACLCIGFAVRRCFYEDIRICDCRVVVHLAVCHRLVGVDLGFARRIDRCIFSDLCIDDVLDDTDGHRRVNCRAVDRLVLTFLLDRNRICTGHGGRLTEVIVHRVDQNADTLCSRAVDFGFCRRINMVPCKCRAYADVFIFLCLA